MVGHWLLGFVWQSEWSITRRWTAAVGLLLALQLVVVTAAVPWAPLKLGALVGTVVWWLRRTARELLADPSPEALDAVYWGTVIVQVAAGFFVAVTAVQNTRL